MVQINTFLVLFYVQWTVMFKEPHGESSFVNGMNHF